MNAKKLCPLGYTPVYPPANGDAYPVQGHECQMVGPIQKKEQAEGTTMTIISIEGIFIEISAKRS